VVQFVSLRTNQSIEHAFQYIVRFSSSVDTCLAVLEGGDTDARAMAEFVSANLDLIEEFVEDGGTLFINSAPNEFASA